MTASIRHIPKRSPTRDALIASYRLSIRSRVEGTVLTIEPSAFAGALLAAATTADRALLASPDGDSEFAVMVRGYLEMVGKEEA